MDFGAYRKTHLFAEEKKWFDPGDTGFQVFDMGQVKIGVMICFDWWFPESARVLALKGADIFCHPANLVMPQCQRVMPAHSLLNGVFTITANRVGTEERGGKAPLQFTGKSQIVDPRGEVLVKLDGEDTGVSSPISTQPRQGQGDHCPERPTHGPAAQVLWVLG